MKDDYVLYLISQNMDWRSREKKYAEGKILIEKHNKYAAGILQVEKSPHRGES